MIIKCLTTAYQCQIKVSKFPIKYRSRSVSASVHKPLFRFLLQTLVIVSKCYLNLVLVYVIITKL